MYCSLIHNLTNWFSLQAEQDVPDFLEECAEQAIGTNFGPEGGQSTPKDIRVSIVKLAFYFKLFACLLMPLLFNYYLYFMKFLCYYKFHIIILVYIQKINCIYMSN